MSRGATDRGAGGDGESPYNPEKRGAWARFGPIAVRFLGPAAAALALVSVITPSVELKSDLALTAPRSVEPGAPIPLRALVYTGLDAIEGPRLAPADVVDVALHGPSGKLKTARLVQGYGPSAEGFIWLDRRTASRAHGALRLVATATLEDGSEVRVERPIELAEQPSADPSLLAPRALRPLQQLALGPIHGVQGVAPPAPFDARVAGGACVPEQPCTIFVHVGEPAAAIAAQSSASVTLEAIEPSRETSGVVALRVRTHGPEAELTLRAERAPPSEAAPRTRVATRAVRLPVALGADAMTIEQLVVPALWSFARVALTGDAPEGVADVFEGDRWRFTGSLQRNGFSSLTLTPGLWRVQLRRDVFGSEGAALRSFVVRASDQSDAAVMEMLERAVMRRAQQLDAPVVEGMRALVARFEGSSSAGDAAELERSAGYLLAILDQGLYRLPDATHGYPLAQARAAAHHADVRRLALVVLALAAVSLALLLVQRGLRGSGEAERVLRASGMSLETLSRARLLRLLRIAGVAVSVLLAFFAIALYLIARGQGQ